MKNTHLLSLFFLLLLAFPYPALSRDNKGHFIVVIDPGHGGHDSGAKGRTSLEKNIVLAVAKKVGEKIKATNSDIKVYYTRSTDKFVGLDQRAGYANSKHADLFVSIHANSTKGSSAYGAETYVLGLHRSQDNLEVAMKENSVILLEDNYSKKYEDFDPNSSESYIIFQFMQNRHLDSSIRLAELVQKGFKSLGRRDRGVRQAGFLVLREVAMPSILVELGFISNPSEEKYMNTSAAQNKLSTEIAQAVVSYEKSVRKKNGNVSGVKRVEKPSPRAATVKQSRPVPASYRVQVLADTRRLPATHPLYKKFGKDLVRFYKEGNYYKYTLYDTSSLARAREHRKALSRKYKDCFIVGFDKNGDKVGSYY